MTTTDLFALSPILAMGALCIITMLGIAVRRHHATIAALAAASTVMTLATLPLAASVAPRTVAMLLRLDTYALLYMGLVSAATLVIIALSYRYWTLHANNNEECEEFYDEVRKGKMIRHGSPRHIVDGYVQLFRDPRRPR